MRAFDTIFNIKMSSLIHSYYEAGVVRPPPNSPLHGEVNADVCVIGGGYTGLSCALELARTGKSVIVVESACAGWGASGRNGGQFICGYSTDNIRLPAAQAGVEEKYLFDLSLAAINLIHQRVQEFNIDCDLRMGYLAAAIHARHCRELSHWADILINRYNYPVQMLDMSETREQIASRRYCAAMLDHHSGHLHPLKYLLGLLRAAQHAGATVYENTPATAINEINGGVRIITPTGQVHCRAAVLAGNAYLDIAPPFLRARIMPAATYIGATAPLNKKTADNLIANRRAVCDMNFILDYFRCSADSRLLFGGRASYRNQTPPNIAQTICRRMTTVFPQLADTPLDYVWSGSVAITINRFPDIGRYGKAIYYAQGFSGHGVALSGFSGKVLADAISGDTEKLDIFGRVKHNQFVGGKLMRTPILALAMLYYRMRDLIG